MEREKVNETVPGRKTKYPIPDIIGDGLIMVYRKHVQKAQHASMEEGEEDELIELQDDGGLDV